MKASCQCLARYSVPSAMATLRRLHATLSCPSRICVTTYPLLSPVRSHATHAYPDHNAHLSSDGPKARRYWSKPEIKAIYDTPLLELVFRAARAHRETHDPSKVQLCTLMNIKSTSPQSNHTRYTDVLIYIIIVAGGCSEDCTLSLAELAANRTL